MLALPLQLCCLLPCSPRTVAIWTLVLCGFFNSIMFHIFTLALSDWDDDSKVGLLMTAVVGGAVFLLLAHWPEWHQQRS